MKSRLVFAGLVGFITAVGVAYPLETLIGAPTWVAWGSAWTLCGLAGWLLGKHYAKKDLAGKP